MMPDEMDREIVEILCQDGRTSFREIARALEVSPETISRRHERLTQEGIITGSTVSIDPTKIGYTFIARFGVNVKPAFATQVLEAIIEIPSVIVASKIVGTHDILVISVIKDFKHLCHLRDVIFDMPHVDKVEVGMWVQTMKLCPRYFII